MTSKCIQPNCNHFHSTVDGQCLMALQGKCLCTPALYMPADGKDPAIKNFAFHQKMLANIQDVHQRVEWMLRSVDGTRNLTDWEFIASCWKYFIGFDFGSFWDKDVFEKISKECQPETIRRARQKICHPELEQLRMFNEELKELSKRHEDGSKAYWDLTERIKTFWIESKYIPNDFDMLRKKKIKESAIFEYSIQEIEDIYAAAKSRVYA